jgi:hypothetical protein
VTSNARSSSAGQVRIVVRTIDGRHRQLILWRNPFETSIALSRPALISSATDGYGILPQPSPAHRNACFTDKSATRQGCRPNTPKSFPTVSVERSARMICVCRSASLEAMAPLTMASGCVGPATVTSGSTLFLVVANSTDELSKAMLTLNAARDAKVKGIV